MGRHDIGVGAAWQRRSAYDHLDRPRTAACPVIAVAVQTVPAHSVSDLQGAFRQYRLHGMLLNLDRDVCRDLEGHEHVAHVLHATK